MTDADRSRVLLRRVLISEAVIAAIVLVSGGGFLLLSAQKPQVTTKQAAVRHLNIDAFAVDPVTFREVLTAWGTARADREVVVAAQVPGEVVEVHPRLEVGEQVSAASGLVSSEQATHLHRGDTLVQVDEREYVRRVEQARTRLAEATRSVEQLRKQEANSQRLLKKARTDVVAFEKEYERFRRAFSLNAGAESEVTRALVELQRAQEVILKLENAVRLFPVQIAAAEDRLAAAQVELERVTDDLRRTRVIAPFDGVLSEVMVEQGQYVRAGEPLFRLTDLRRIEIPVAIGLDDWQEISAALRQGDSPDVRLATGQSAAARWTGRIVRISPKADPESRTIRAFVEVLNDQQEQKLLPGTFVHARITGALRSDAIVIPRECVYDGHVFIVRDEGIVHRQPVKQGRRLKSLVVITEGLTGNEQIATTNLNLLREGRRVEIQETTDLTDELAVQSWPLIEIVQSPELTQSPGGPSVPDSVR